MRVAIIDEDKNWQLLEKTEVEMHYGEYVQIDLFSSGEEFLREKAEYQMVFMDVDLPGEDGFTISKKYYDIYQKFILVIVTARTELSRKGYQFNAFRYIDKEYPEEIQEALDSADKMMEKYRRLSVHVLKSGVQDVYCKDIVYIEASDHNVRICTTQNVFVCRESIGKLSKILDNAGFFRIHRAYLVNFNFVRCFDDRDVYSYNGDRLPISRRNYTSFKKRFIKWRFENGHDQVCFNNFS